MSSTRVSLTSSVSRGLRFRSRGATPDDPFPLQDRPSLTCRVPRTQHRHEDGRGKTPGRYQGRDGPHILFLYPDRYRGSGSPRLGHDGTGEERHTNTPCTPSGGRGGSSHCPPPTLDTLGQRSVLERRRDSGVLTLSPKIRKETSGTYIVSGVSVRNGRVKLKEKEHTQRRS